MRSCRTSRRGTVTLIGATTENPSFEVIAPLLSRTSVLVLQPLAPDDGARAGRARARRLRARPGRRAGCTIAPPALRVPRRAIARRRARRARTSSRPLPIWRVGAATAELTSGDPARRPRSIVRCATTRAARSTTTSSSAFIKSMRGSDPDAAVYWMMRMLDAGEDPLFVARRMVIFAAEDVGLRRSAGVGRRRGGQGRRRLHRPARRAAFRSPRRRCTWRLRRNRTAPTRPCSPLPKTSPSTARCRCRCTCATPRRR